MIFSRNYDITVGEHHLEKVAEMGWPQGELLYTIADLISQDETEPVCLIEGRTEEGEPSLYWLAESYVCPDKYDEDNELLYNGDKVLYKIDDWAGEELAYTVS